MSDPSELIASKIERARELCGCTQCQGGYEIGARTLAGPSPYSADNLNLHRVERPSSCVAAVVLTELLTRIPMETSGRRGQELVEHDDHLERVAAVEAKNRVTWRGSVSDLVTDLMGLLTLAQMIELARTVDERIDRKPSTVTAREIVLALADDVFICDSIGDVVRGLYDAAALVEVELPKGWFDAKVWDEFKKGRGIKSLKELKGR